MKSKVYCMDCMELMRSIPDKSVDLIIADPPYVALEENTGTIRTTGNKQSSLALGGKPSDEVFQEIFRVSKHNLEWCTRSYNVNYGSRIKKQRKALIKPVVAYSKAYEFVKEFDSLVDASKFAKVNATNISRACKKEGRISGGYLWEYKNIEK